MKKLNFHGLTNIDREELRKTAHYTDWLTSAKSCWVRREWHNDIYYNRRTGEIHTPQFTDNRSWWQSEDSDWIYAGDTHAKLTQQEILDMIWEALQALDRFDAAREAYMKEEFA